MKLRSLALATALVALPIAAHAQCNPCAGILTDSTFYAGCYNYRCNDAPTAPSPTAPADTLKAERDSYQRELDACIKQRDAVNKQIGALAAQLKSYNAAIAKLK